MGWAALLWQSAGILGLEALEELVSMVVDYRLVRDAKGIDHLKIVINEHTRTEKTNGIISY